ncbi:DUF3014 domain-containing protein [Dyella choica]|uniref:DUF3014 domain-containing protein n=1 Tax=Dyella choica TaxID=1927959 RepID=UPI001E31E351|nr:DUF3014 domain-containing protein [Dyella choica]
MNRRAPKQTSYGGWIAAIIVVLAVVAAGVYLVQRAMHPSAAAPAAAPINPPAAQPAQQPASASSAIQHPIARANEWPASASTAALPSLADSDAEVREALQGLAHGGNLGALLQSQIISRVVATVDALPRQSMGSTNILPLRTPKGTMQTEQANGATVIGAGNGERYAPYMTVLADVDPHALVAWYKHSYPLFQQAYRELGYPRGYFNDRLIVAIDDMLAAPHVQGPVAVVRSGARYHFVEPQLQSLSNGQKLMVRLGSQNEEQFKAKLRAIRELLASAGR